MVVDSKVKYGQEHGKNLVKIAKKIIKNENLLMLLMNTDRDPLNKDKHPETINGLELLNKNIMFVPFMQVGDEKTTSKIVLIYDEGNVNQTNSDNENIVLIVSVMCPFVEWIIAGDDVRPYAIMAEIRKSLDGARINGLGEIRYKGFSLSSLTEEVGAFTMRFIINAFS